MVDMDYTAEAKSQPVLPQAKRVWATSDLPRSRSMFVRQRELDRREQRPPSALQPLSRPQSRSGRPPSRTARPSSRLEHRLPATAPQAGGSPTHDLQRPVSGRVRPLSGRVFMRRTSGKGWVAKAYPNDPYDQDLGIYDDLSDSGSLDSFFDDDFDLEQKDEKLQNLLSCNTLGVESKGRKPDWVAGEIDIPKFHCPRCRDHWYGLNPFPCDEELARLIREGLWYTGKGEVAKSVREAKDAVLRKRQTSAKLEFEGSSSDSLPQIKNRGGMLGRSGGVQRDPLSLGTGESSAKKKSKRRITFKLASDDSDSHGSGTFDDAEGEGTGRTRGSGRTGSRRRGSGLDEELDTKLSSSGGQPGYEGHKSNRGYRDNLAASDESSTSLGGSGKTGKKKRHGGEVEGIDSDSSGLLDGRGDIGRRTRRRERGEAGGGGIGSGVDGGEGRVGDGRGRSGLETPVGGGGGDGSGGRGDKGRDSLKNSSRSGLTRSGTQDGQGLGGSVHGEGGGDGWGGGSELGRGSRRGSLSDKTSSSRGSRANLHSSSQGWSGERPVDHGKSVRKGGGHMRAASPSQSDWGDPYHARPYLSSTATSSRTGSTSNLLQDREEEEEGEGRATLPPIADVPAISNKKPFLDMSDLFDGFQFTRAWTFSYHNAGPL